MTFICPISYEPTIFPVVTNDGHVYEFVSIARHLLSTETNLDPLTRQEISILVLIHPSGSLPEIELSIIDQYLIAYYCHQLMSQKPEINLTAIPRFDGIHRLIEIAKDFSLIAEAAKEDRLDVVEAFLGLPSFQDRIYSAEQETPLHYSVLNRNRHMMCLLLEETNSSPNSCNSNGDGPIHLLAASGQCSLMAIFLDKADSFNPNLLSRSGLAAIHIAASCGDLAMLELLFRDPRVNQQILTKRHESLIFLAVNANQAQILLYLLQKNIYDINVPDFRGVTPFNHAVFLNNSCFSILYHHADLKINRSTHLQRHPLHGAVYCGSLVLLKLLWLHRDINKEPRNWKGLSPYQLALKLGRKEIAEWLENQMMSESRHSFFHEKPAATQPSKTPQEQIIKFSDSALKYKPFK